MTELPGDFGEHRALCDHTARLPQGLLHHPGIGEVKEQRDEIGKALVEGQHVDIRRLVEVGTQPIEEGMGRLVGDDIVRQRREHEPPWDREPGRLLLRPEITERQIS